MRLQILRYSRFRSKTAELSDFRVHGLLNCEMYAYMNRGNVRGDQIVRWFMYAYVDSSAVYVRGHQIFQQSVYADIR